MKQYLSINWGQQLAFKAIAKQILSRLGVVGREPTDEEVVRFAQGGFNADAIADYYSFLPELVAKQPGLPYGMSAEEYRQATEGYGAAYRSIFGRDAEGMVAPVNKEGRASSLFGFALTNRVSPLAFGQTVEQFRQERGRAPTAPEFAERAARPDSRVGPSGGYPGTTPTPREQAPGGREARPAVGGR